MEITFKYFAEAKAVKRNGVVVSFSCWGNADAENERSATAQIVQIINDHARANRMMLAETPLVSLIRVGTALDSVAAFNSAVAAPA